MARCLLHVAPRDTGIEGGGDERMAEGVRADRLVDTGLAGESSHDPPSGVAIQPPAVATQEDRTVDPFADLIPIGRHSLMGNVGLCGRAVEQAAAVDALTGELAGLIDCMKAVNAPAELAVCANLDAAGFLEAPEVRLDIYLAAVRSKGFPSPGYREALETVMSAQAGVIGVDPEP